MYTARELRARMIPRQAWEKFASAPPFLRSKRAAEEWRGRTGDEDDEQYDATAGERGGCGVERWGVDGCPNCYDASALTRDSTPRRATSRSIPAARTRLTSAQIDGAYDEATIATTPATVELLRPQRRLLRPPGALQNTADARRRPRRGQYADARRRPRRGQQPPPHHACAWAGGF